MMITLSKPCGHFRHFRHLPRNFNLSFLVDSFDEVTQAPGDCMKMMIILPKPFDSYCSRQLSNR
jgi:hypothetical protein